MRYAVALLGCLLIGWTFYASVGRHVKDGPTPISVEQQNRVLKAQIDAFKAAIDFKNAELRRWEAGADKEKFSKATQEAVDARASLEKANGRISTLADQIKKEDHCETCVPLADFTWKKP